MQSVVNVERSTLDKYDITVKPNKNDHRHVNFIAFVFSITLLQ